MTIEKYSQSIYAGVLGKIIGVYLGRPVEGWPYKKIQREFGEVSYFVNKSLGVPLIVADDDISGTFGFFNTIEDNHFSRDISSKDIGDTWLNFIIEDKTILWWGGLGRSTEHTAFLRLKSGINAPDSGSIKLNGRTIAEQIGAQIFIDAFAIMSPGDPDLAVYLIRRAASVSHDGLAVDAACFLGAMEALAFDVKSLDELLDLSFKYISSDYLKKVIGDVRWICGQETEWRKVREWLDKHYGYDRFPGPCHIIPNHSMVIASLLLGRDDFQKSITIASSAGWDTDCNAGNVGCLNGIRLGLEGISAGADFRTPVGDKMYVVTADSGSCITDAVQQARKIIRAAAAYRNESIQLSDKRFSFEFRGSTQGFEVCPYTDVPYPVLSLRNLNESSSENGLVLEYRALAPGARCCVSTPVFVDLSTVAKNFSTIASPTLYSSQTIISHIKAFADENPNVRFYLLYYDAYDEVRRIDGEVCVLKKGENELRWKVPDTGGMPIFRLGLELISEKRLDGQIAVVDIDWKGAPEEFAQKGMLMKSIWDLNPHWLQIWASSAKQFAPDFKYTYCISHPDDDGVVSTGTQDWTDFCVESSIYFNLHKTGGLVARSKGHKRYYAAILSGGDTASLIMRKDHVIKCLASTEFKYEQDRLYSMSFQVKGNELALYIEGTCILSATDPDQNYSCGAAGFLVEQGTILADGFLVRKIDPGKEKI